MRCANNTTKICAYCRKHTTNVVISQPSVGKCIGKLYHQEKKSQPLQYNIQIQIAKQDHAATHTRKIKGTSTLSIHMIRQMWLEFQMYEALSIQRAKNT
jgi:hypothetical protein